MVDALVGAVIMVVATTSLFLAVEVAEDAFTAAGRYPMNEDELKMLVDLKGRASTSVWQLIDDVEGQLTNQLPRQYQQNNDLEDSSASGMSVLELLLATTMLMVFTGVVAAVMEVTLRFMGEAECPVDVSGVRRCNDEDSKDVAHGVLIDRHSIEVLFDQLEPVLVQPGIHRSRIKAISGALGDPPAQPACTPAATTSFGLPRFRNSQS